MLYLIKQEGKNQNYLKIGYSKNMEDRLKAYNTHNANFELIETIEGEKDIETCAHLVLTQFKYKGEWYKEDDEIYLIWNLCKHESRIRKNEEKIKKLEEKYAKLKEIIAKIKEKIY